MSVSQTDNYMQPAPEEIRKIVAAHAKHFSFKLYRPGLEWLHQEYAGIQYYFPPDLGGEMVAHPHHTNPDGSPKMCRADGVLEISDRVGSDGLVRENAQDIVRFLLGVHGEAGVVLVGRTVHEDEKAITYAKRRYRTYRKNRAEEEISAWQAKMDTWKKVPANQGKPTPPPPENVSRAQAFLDECAETEEAKYQYVCPVGGCIGTNDWAEFARHMKVNHGQTLTLEEWESKEEAGGAPAEPKDEVPEETAAPKDPAKRGRRKPSRSKAPKAPAPPAA